MTTAERMQVMGHHRPEIYDRHYLNEIIESDTLGILLGTPSDKSLMDLASHMSLTRDQNAPRKLTAAQIKETMADPDLVNLKTRCCAQKAALPDKTLKKGRISDPESYAEYVRLRKQYDSLRVSLLRDKREQVWTDYFSTVGAHYIDLQRRGYKEAELIAEAPQFEISERTQLVDLLFPNVNDDVKPSEVIDWPSDLHHCKIVDLLAALCSRRCSPARKTSRDERMVYIEPEVSPDHYPIVCTSTICLFCLGDSSLPKESREFHYSRPSSLTRHVKTQHLRLLKGTFLCPHPACLNHNLCNDMGFFNHALVVHNVRH
jgi:hypothetical protein